jgi:HD-GYP domain-containing protein (c-di-GMP phosphodiesterase class II)
MAVADVFTAIMEERPYRKGLNNSEAMKIIKQLCQNGGLDAAVAAILEKHFDDINYRRIIAQEASISDYKLFLNQ